MGDISTSTWPALTPLCEELFGALHDHVHTPNIVTSDGTGFPVPSGGRRLAVGRGGDVLVAHAYSSRLHAEVWLEDGTLMVDDLGSRNGTAVLRVAERIPVTGATVLQPGDDVVTTEGVVLFRVPLT